MSWNEATSLDESLLSLNQFFVDPPLMAETLVGGLTNRCWKVTSSKGVPYVWRPTSTISFQFGISRSREHQLLESLKSHYFAPNSIYLSEKGLLVEWLEGQVGRFPISETDIIATLCNIHSVNIHNKPVPLFSYTSKVDGYWHRLDKSQKTPQMIRHYQRLREQPSITPVSPALCHLDLGQYNMVMSEQGIKVIDWEYAGVADPRMDLAMTIELAELDMPRSVANYCQIRNIEDVDIWLQGVNQWQSRNMFMALLWYLLGYQIWQDDSYLQQADELRNRL